MFFIIFYFFYVEGFDPLTIPGNWDEAIIHGKSRMTASEKENGDKSVCKCCGYEIVIFILNLCLLFF